MLGAVRPEPLVNPLLKLILFVGLLAAAVARAAEPTSVDKVRAELEQQLQALVDSPAPEVQLLFQGLKQEEYKLVEVRFTLDGEPIDALSHTLPAGQGLQPDANRASDTLPSP